MRTRCWAKRDKGNKQLEEEGSEEDNQCRGRLKGGEAKGFLKIRLSVDTWQWIWMGRNATWILRSRQSRKDSYVTFIPDEAKETCGLKGSLSGIESLLIAPQILTWLILSSVSLLVLAQLRQAHLRWRTLLMRALRRYAKTVGGMRFTVRRTTRRGRLCTRVLAWTNFHHRSSGWG